MLLSPVSLIMKKLIAIFCWLNVLNLVYTHRPEICPNIITKQQWEARDGVFIDYTIFPLEYVIIHHTVTEPCSSLRSCSSLVANIQSFHLDNLEYGDIGYNFLIGGDGNVYEGLGWHKQGAHTLGYNKISIGIAFIGNFEKTLPTVEQLQAARNLLQCGVEMGELSEDYKLYGGRQVSPTASPGTKLFDKLRTWAHFAKPDQ